MTNTTRCASRHSPYSHDSLSNSLFLPTLFTELIGEGASGLVWRSLTRSQVVKVFNDRDLALREANVLEHARSLPVPTLQGVVEGEGETGVVMSYEGNPIGDLERATPEQR
jgi:hypothetical protein